MTVSDREFGEVLIRRNQDDTYTIVSAAPRTRISWEFLREDCCWKWGPQPGFTDGIPLVTLAGTTIVITGTNARYVYKITGFDATRKCYEAEWPD